MGELVSILIPAYNVEKWIGFTIKSALDQTWQEKEIIIVDDGSTDFTFRIAKQYESKLITVIKQENKGACSARNKAFSVAQGDYIQWLDADDLLAPDKIEMQLKQADSGRNSKILLTGAWTKFYYRSNNAKFIPNALWRDLDPVEWLMAKFSENVWMNPASWLVSRKLAELAGPWDERLIRDQDGEYICRVISNAEKVKFVAEGKSYYRQWNPKSLTRGISNKAGESLLLALRSSINYLRSMEDSERTRAACVKYLQIWLDYFYPEKEELVREMNKIAKSLGGELIEPSLSWKYRIIKDLIGWSAAKEARIKVADAKLRVSLFWDLLVGKITGAEEIQQ